MNTPKTPVSELEDKAESGDIEACRALGLLYELGLESKPDLVKARKYYEMAARGGDKLSVDAATAIIKGGLDGTKPDLKKATELINQYRESVENQSISDLSNPELLDINIQMKVLVVDDSPQDLTLMGQALNQAGYHPIKAESAESALSLLKKHPDVKMVFTDMNLPQIDGINMIGRIRKSKAFEEIPIVVVSAVKDANVISRAKKSGIHGWILKPFNAQTIVKSADRWVRNKS